MQYSIVNVLALAATASAATIKVAVGQNGLTYSPSDIKAAPGDEVEFTYFPKNHTVSQSSFGQPCKPLAGGFFSGFVPTAAPGPSNTTFTITVKDTKPVWIYCGQTVGSHCQSGMVAAINAPSTGNTLAAFAKLAKNATTVNFSGGAVGGILKVSGSNNTATSTTGGSTSLSTSSFTSTYATSAVISTVITSSYTSNGQAYATTFPTIYTTSYTTAVPTASVVASVSGGTPAGTSSAGSPTNTTSGAGGLVASMFAVGAGLLAAILMV
ncbi:hypothetical protein HYFRA_00012451 [Hymenoscyphus fraxineus]|uniref:Cupredoxin n=1 Tax=Hymenoscyphus fraxineus TaxID=746836 RepID=A0A9N9L8B8_9HELO|nr:hypothetical protein HYFRA_00012451 [Hymenoscyphus fraxineus]